MVGANPWQLLLPKDGNRQPYQSREKLADSGSDTAVPFLIGTRLNVEVIYNNEGGKYRALVSDVDITTQTTLHITRLGMQLIPKPYENY